MDGGGGGAFDLKTVKIHSGYSERVNKSDIHSAFNESSFICTVCMLAIRRATAIKM